MTERLIKTVLIASGSGTDADAIMKDYARGCIPNVEIVQLISTKEGAGCLAKAEKLGIDNRVLDRKNFDSLSAYNSALATILTELNVELIFLVGCIIKIYPIVGVKTYNIHPADPHQHGGNGMYGLEVHMRVLLEVVDIINRGKASLNDKFFTLPTVHEAFMDYDSSESMLAQIHVEIPREIIETYLKNDDLEAAAKALQQHVLPYEWMILPTAVQMAAKKIFDEESKGG